MISLGNNYIFWLALLSRRYSVLMVTKQCNRFFYFETFTLPDLGLRIRRFHKYDIAPHFDQLFLMTTFFLNIILK